MCKHYLIRYFVRSIIPEECHPLSQTLGRCGPNWGGRCNKDLVDYAVYCNVENGWCGTSEDHKNAQDGDEYDWQPKPCRGKIYHLIFINYALYCFIL